MGLAKQSQSHVRNRVAGRRAKGTWFSDQQIGEKISAGKRRAFAAMSSRQKRLWRKRQSAVARRVFIGRKHSAEHIAKRTASRLANMPNDFGKRISQGKKAAWKQLPHEKKEQIENRLRKLAADKRIIRDPFFCKNPDCGKQLTGRQKNFCSRACRNKIHAGKNQFGEFNPNWKNGTTAAVRAFYSSHEYFKWATAIKKRDKYTCQTCGSRKNLQAHHIKSAFKYPELALIKRNGKTLCDKCHIAIHH